MRVLIIDDASAVRLLLSKLLRSILPGVDVSLCANGKSALIMLSTEISFDLVILDLGLPDVSGFDILSFIESQGITTPVITISDESNQEALIESIQRGANSYLTKPIQRTTLAQRISENVSLNNPSSGKKKVLVVDDEEVNRFLFRKISEGAGFEVLEAKNGYEAVRAVKLHVFDCILMDLRMPYMDGREASRIILKELPFIPIIVITGENVSRGGRELLDLGIKAVLEKPITPRPLLESMKEQMEKASMAFEDFGLSSIEKQDIEPDSRQLGAHEDFYKFVPKSFVNPEDMKEKFQRGLRHVEDCTVMFIDIRKFTEMTEDMTAGQTFNFLNSYFELVEPIINSFGGMVYQFLGDGIVATFPLYREKYSNNAVHAAISVQDNITIYNRGRVRAGYEPISIGIGISTGPLAMGICGSKNRYEVGAFGSTMNIAARSQSACRDFGIDIVITSKTCEIIDNPGSLLIRPIGQHKLKGIKKEVPLFEVFSHSNPVVRQLKSECFKELPHLSEELKDEDIDRLASHFPEDVLWENLRRLKKTNELP